MSRALMYDYWQYQLTQLSIDEILFSNRKHRFTSNARIVYCSFINQTNGVLRSGWSLCKDDRDLSGFLSHIFIPTAILNWHEDLDDLYIPMSDMETLLSQIGHKALLQTDKLLHYLKYCAEAFDFDKLTKITEEFNKAHQTTDKMVYLKVFKDADDVVRTITDAIEFDEVFIEEFGMTKQTFRTYLNNAQDNQFLSMKIIDYLNAKIPYLI